MKRFHVHVHVADLDKSIGFYSTLFGAEPARVRGRLREVDARRPAHQLRHLDARRGSPASTTWACRPTTRPNWRHEVPRRGGRRARCSTKAPPPAAMRAAKSTGSPTRRASPGSSSTRWPTSRCSARPRPTRRPAARPRRAASRAGGGEGRLRLLLRNADERQALPGAVRLHRQFGALDPGRRPDDRAGARRASSAIRPAATRRIRPHPLALQTLAAHGIPTDGLSQQELGRVCAAGRAGAGLRLHRLRPGGRRSLPVLARPADDRALGAARPGGGAGQRGAAAQGLPRHLRRAQAPHRAAA